jgi:hypothetical protein
LQSCYINNGLMIWTQSVSALSDGIYEPQTSKL